MSDDARWRRIEKIFGGALERTGPDRTAFVAAACGDDESLRQEVETLLAYASAGQPFLTPSIDTLAAPVIGGVPATLEEGARFGPIDDRYASGHLLFVGNHTLVAQPFDTRSLKLSGDAFPAAHLSLQHCSSTAPTPTSVLAALTRAASGYNATFSTPSR